MTDHDGEDALHATEPKPLRRRDRFLALMIERQARGRIADQARIVLARHHHAVADLDPSISQPDILAASRRRAGRNDRNIERIRSAR